MNEIECDGKLSRKSSVKKPDKDLKARVEEFKLWHDDSTFLQLEYEQRRNRQQQLKGLIRNDGRLRKANLCYVPSGILVLIGLCLVLFSTVDGLAGKTAMWKDKIYYQVAGAILLALGLMLLMATAMYTYRREDRVRSKHGFPSLYEASRSGQGSLKTIEDSMAFTYDFVERSSSKGRLSRMTSVESKASLSNLGLSFSSTSTTMSWLHKHKREHNSFALTSLRRDQSDSALDTFFARKHNLHSWQVQASNNGTGNDEIVNKRVDAKNEEQNIEKSTDGTSDSLAFSSTSTTSSGYHSNMSSPTHSKVEPTFTRTRLCRESVSEECDCGTHACQDLDLETKFTNEIVEEPSRVAEPLLPIIVVNKCPS